MRVPICIYLKEWERGQRRREIGAKIESTFACMHGHLSYLYIYKTEN